MKTDNKEENEQLEPFRVKNFTQFCLLPEDTRLLQQILSYQANFHRKNAAYNGKNMVAFIQVLFYQQHHQPSSN